MRFLARPLLPARWTLALLVAVASLAASCTCQPAPPIPDAARDAAPGDAPRDACTTCVDAAADAAVDDRRAGDRAAEDARSLDRNAADAIADTGSEDLAGVDRVLPDASREDAPPDDAASEAGPLALPATPTGLQASAGALVRLTFDAAARAERYQALVAESPGGPYRAHGLASATAELWLDGLGFGLPHYLVVRALNAAGSSPSSSEVEATPRDGVSALRGRIEGTVRQGGNPVPGAEVRLYTEVDHGLLLARAVTAADGRYTLDAPSGLHRGLIAGFDELPQDGDAFELGYDSVGVLLADVAGQAFVFELAPGQTLTGLDIALDLAWLERRIEGHVQVGAGWPLGRLLVEASPVGMPLRPARAILDAPGSYRLDLEPGVYDLQAFLDVDGDGAPGLNEPRSAVRAAVDVSALDATGQDLAIPAAAAISGTLRGADGWSVMAVEEGARAPAIFTRPAPAGVPFELVVMAERNYRVQAFVDVDGNGRRTLLDVDGSALLDAPEETWLEPGLPARAGVAADASGVDFDADLTRWLRGSVAPAMRRWSVVARDPSGERTFATRAAPDGSFALAVLPHDSYLVLAYVDADGDGRRTPWLEPVLLHGAVVDAATADVEGIAIVERRLSGTVTGTRAVPGEARAEVILAQQLVQGLGGGLLCASPVEIASATRLAPDAPFTLAVGALGSGGGSRPWSDCAPTCTGVTLIRYLDQGGDYAHHGEGCVAADPLVYPASLADPGAEALVLDTSAGDLTGLDF